MLHDIVDFQFVYCLIMVEVDESLIIELSPFYVIHTDVRLSIDHLIIIVNEQLTVTEH